MKPPTSSDAHVSLRRAVRGVAEFDVETIRRTATSGTTFGALADAAERIVEFARKLPDDVITWLPKDTCKTSVAKLDAAAAALKASVTAQPTSDLSAIERELDAAHEKLLLHTAPVLAWAKLAMGWPEHDRVLRAADGIPKAIEAAGAAVAACERATADAKTLSDRLNVQLGDSVFTKESLVFRDEAKSHQWSARLWLGVSVFVGAALILTVLDALVWHRILPATADGDRVDVAIVAGRVMLFATISSFLVVALRQFAAGRHNSIVNRHRANALAVYAPLINVSKDPRVRDIILTHAASSIFAPQPTGLSKTSVDGPDGSTASALLAALSSRGRPVAGE